MQECPNAFPRFHDSANVSAAINKFLEENRLKETPRHKAYSLRHSFEDRMIDAKIDDRIRRDLFGHRLDRERYGTARHSSACSRSFRRPPSDAQG